jgi:amino acid adenylation domain-containing protein/thioester reductase-like protein
MVNDEKQNIAAVLQAAWSRHGDAYIVAVNDEEQHAMWPAARALPAGWRRQSAAMNRQACLTAIAAAWTDITPAGLRVAPPGAGIAGDAIPREDAPRYVHDLLDAQARRRPRSVAVVCGAEKLTYSQLAQSSNQLAHFLRGMGVGPEILVGVCLKRGIEVIRSLLAILKAGGAYLPLDPALPTARLSQMCEEARPAIIVTGSTDARAFSGTGARLLLAEEIDPVVTGLSTAAPAVSLRAGNLAYAIYTSGSTGRPKAVAVSHGSLARHIREISAEYRISPHHRVVQLASLGFDTSLEQIFVALLSGATLMLPPPDILAPTDLLGYLAEKQVTVMDLTPAYWHQLLAIAIPGDKRLNDVRLMITGGDMADWGDCQAALRAASGARMVNAYGLTETTITSALFDVSGEMARPQPGSPVPVGKPTPHAQVLVLDENLDTVPTGALGEIYIGGSGVARGYLGRPALTAERFLPNPHSAVPGSRMYRTGDLGRWRADQNLEVIGRLDRQLKIRGFRVEPAEIERVLTDHPDIDEAAVIAHDFGPGNVQLAAYYTRRHNSRPGLSDNDKTQDSLSSASLRNFLSTQIPSFMVPAAFIALHQIPRMPDGTVDWQALAYPVNEASASPGAEQYTPTQAGLSHLWSKILKTGRVSLDDDFFSLGGNSLLAAEMLAHTRVMFGIGADFVRPLTRCLLRNPTLRGFSAATQAARAGTLTAEGTEPRVDFAREATLDLPFRQRSGSPPEWNQPRQILLTGASGFFGVHLLRELLTSTTAQVHCLIRARDAPHVLRRIAWAAERYELGELAMDRVVPVVGDLAEPNLGLPASKFSELAQTLDVIHHAGALVNFIYPYADLRETNVTGTKEIIRLAGLCRGIPIHYVSTTAVLAGFGAMGVREVTEDTPLAYADRLCVGYIETKFVAEELLRSASRIGLPVAIYRPLDIVGDQRVGTWNTATEMCALIRFIADTGYAPDIDLPLDFVPADICAAAIRYISSHAQATGATYHISSPKYALLGSLVDRLRHQGYAVEGIPYDEWVNELLKHAAHHPAHPMTPFVPLFVDSCAESKLTVAEMYLEHIFPSYTRSNTERALSGSGIAFPAVDEKLLDLTITRLMASGFLPDPRIALAAQAPGENQLR